MIIKTIQHFSDIDAIKSSGIYDFYNEELASPNEIGRDKILISGPLYRVLNTTILIAEGVYHSFDEATGTLTPDYPVSLLYSSVYEPDLNKPLHWEKEPPAIMFHNYAQMQEKLGNDTKYLLSRCIA